MSNFEHGDAISKLHEMAQIQQELLLKLRACERCGRGGQTAAPPCLHTHAMERSVHTCTQRYQKQRWTWVVKLGVVLVARCCRVECGPLVAAAREIAAMTSKWAGGARS